MFKLIYDKPLPPPFLGSNTIPALWLQIHASSLSSFSPGRRGSPSLPCYCLLSKEQTHSRLARTLKCNSCRIPRALTQHDLASFNPSSSKNPLGLSMCNINTLSEGVWSYTHSDSCCHLVRATLWPEWSRRSYNLLRSGQRRGKRWTRITFIYKYGYSENTDPTISIGRS